MTTIKAKRVSAKQAAAARATKLATFATDVRKHTNAVRAMAETVKALVGSAWVVKDGKRLPTESAKEVRDTFMAGYMAGRLASLHNLTDAKALEQARAILKRPGPDSKAKADARQTKEQATVAAAGRKMWQRILDEAGLMPVVARTGKQNAKGTNKPKTAPAAPKTVEVPIGQAKALPLQGKAVNDKEQATQWFVDHAALMAAQVERLNQSLYKARKETLPPNLCEAVKMFKEAIAKATS